MTTITSIEPITVAAHTSAIAICLNLAHRMFEIAFRAWAATSVTGDESYRAWWNLRATAAVLDARKSLRLSREELDNLRFALGVTHRAAHPLTTHMPAKADCICRTAQDIRRLEKLFGDQI